MVHIIAFLINTEKSTSEELTLGQLIFVDMQLPLHKFSLQWIKFKI